MQVINAVMLLLGCSHDAQICQPLEVAAPYYETVQTCESDVLSQEHLYGDGYPITVAKCLDVDNLPAQEAVKINWHFNDNGVLIAYAGPVEATTPATDSDVLFAASEEQSVR